MYCFCCFVFMFCPVFGWFALMFSWFCRFALWLAWFCCFDLEWSDVTALPWCSLMLWLYCLIWPEFACGSVCLALFLLKVLIFGVSSFSLFLYLLPLFTIIYPFLIPFNTFLCLFISFFSFFFCGRMYTSCLPFWRKREKWAKKYAYACGWVSVYLFAALVVWLCCVVCLILLPAKCGYAFGWESSSGWW